MTAAPSPSLPPFCTRCAAPLPTRFGGRTAHARLLSCAVTKLLEIHGDSGVIDTGAKVTVAGDAPDALGVGEVKDATVGAD